MSRVLLDTNIIISALLFPNSTPDRVLRLVLNEHALVLTDWIMEELDTVVRRKRPDLLPALEEFIASINPEIAPVGTSEQTIADPADQPILDAAISAQVDVIVTGDKHFLSLAIDQPQVLTARAFLDAFFNE
ncbi:MAG: putative toxin-antitoxin system toxin component, PIN family [Candidatus Nanopelagicales bacterium]